MMFITVLTGGFSNGWSGGGLGNFVCSPAFAPQNLFCSSKFCVAFLYNTVWYNYISLERLY